jgi:AAA15 family ATPase/GTPase
MLLNFTLENYKSYNEDQRFTMVPGKYRKKKEHIVKKKDMNILKLATIYGGNASGKSNFVGAINDCRMMIVKGRVMSSHKDISFKLNTTINHESKFEFEIAIKEKRFAYGFAINFSKGKILKEYLYQLKNKSEEMIYDFNYDDKELEFEEKRISKSNIDRIRIYKEDFETKDEEFFLNYFCQGNFKDNDEVVKDIQSVFNWFKYTLTVITPDTKPLDIIGLFDQGDSENEENTSVIDLIRSFDTGITDFSKAYMTIEELVNRIRKEVPNQLQEEIGELEESIYNLNDNDNVGLILDENYFKIYKKAGDEAPIVELLTFNHCFNNKCEFTFREESDGTRRLIELVNILFISQFTNKVFVVDELNRSLHPNLTIDFVEKFLLLSSKNESQMILTTHETSLMSLEILRQDEIWIVDRLEDGSSNLFPLSKYALRSDKVLNKDYLQGRYGGIPQIFKLLKN